ncbi:MAG: spore cortex biosynthesis protein YabQ [Bacillota bacterium]
MYPPDLQAYTVAVMVLGGVLLGTLLEFANTAISVFRLKGLWASLIYLVFWTLATVVMFGFLMIANWGEARLHSVLSALLGFWLYQILGRPVVSSLCRAFFTVLGRVFRIVAYLVIFVTFPVVLILKLFAFPVTWIQDMMNSILDRFSCYRENAWNPEGKLPRA